MAAELRKHGPVDRKNINVNDSWEVTWWCKRLECTEERLNDAVQSVGNSSTRVNEYLKKGN
jgi:hypothetical protein